MGLQPINDPTTDQNFRYLERLIRQSEVVEQTGDSSNTSSKYVSFRRSWAGNGLYWFGHRLTVLPAPDSGIVVSSAGVSVKLKAGGGILADDSGLYLGTSLHGEMYSYENGVAVIIDELGIYHAISTIDSTGLCSGWTFKSGSTGPIANFATYDGGLATLITDVGHGLLSGEIITIANSTNYNGVHVTTKVSNDTFSIPVAYVAEAGGPNWIRGSSLRAGIGSAGVYKISWGTTCWPAVGGDNFKIMPKVNTVDLAKMAASMRLTAAADYRNINGGGLVTIADEDYIWFVVRNEDAVDNITFRHFNVNITRV